MVPEPQPRASTPAWSDRRRLAYEKESLGFYLTGHPLTEHSERLQRQASHTTASLEPGVEGPITIGGVVTRPQRTKIKSGPNAGRLMGRFVLEDLEGSVPVAVFADTFDRCGHLLEEEAIVIIKASVRERGSHVELGVEEVTPLDEVTRRAVALLAVDLPAGLSPAQLLRLRDVITENPGTTPVASASEPGRRSGPHPADGTVPRALRREPGAVDRGDHRSGPGAARWRRRRRPSSSVLLPGGRRNWRSPTDLASAGAGRVCEPGPSLHIGGASSNPVGDTSISV